MSSAAQRARQLLAEQQRLLEAAWDDERAMVRHAQHPDLHDPRATLAYASALLGEGDPDRSGRAARAIRSVLALQERRPDDAHYGNFRWMAEDEGVTDLNGVEFMLDGLNAIVHRYRAALPPDLLEEMLDAISLGLSEIEALDVHPSYTNIALSDISNSVLGGEATGDAECVGRGERRLDEWFAFTNASGAPHEFNSPTYLGVDIARMAELAAATREPRIAAKARLAAERLWAHVAAHYHPGLAQLAGPHARSYFDGWTGAPGYLKLFLWRLLGDDRLRAVPPFAPRSREEGHAAAARDELFVPAYADRWLREKRFPFEVIETTDAARGLDIATYMTAAYALGTASRHYTVGDPPEPWPAFNSLLLHVRRDEEPGFGVLFARYVSDDAGIGVHPQPAGRMVEDWWDEGQFAGAQHRNRAILAYGLMPRMRRVHSYKLSVNVLGLASGAEVWVGEERVAAFPRTVQPGEPVIIDMGAAYAALIPLEPTDMGSGAPIELRFRDGHLALDIYNYRGPAKQFWEYRSLSGPFYRGNVRSAFVLEVGTRDEHGDLAAFRRHIAAASIADTTGDDLVREIAYSSAGGSIALRYSLWDMALVERRYDGVPFVAPMSRAGAVDGGGPQWAQSRSGIVELGRTKLLAGGAPCWLLADDEAGAWLVANPSADETPLWLETPAVVVECEALPYGRLEVDAARHRVAVDVADAMGPLRLISDQSYRVTVNGADVTDEMAAAGDGALELRR